ncbi:hypothetical protein DCCM_2046 [Desulfocucumis palustris]|uniref:Uncharacterized protein n=1 Tax=Desulfocucumis palustris TaxID=1898651 RepID=A0A2L2X9M9_9FIRM|nr:hypothetical protein [Desulfocucumis palustris]GBF32949.1 hypothetical protein DCCM_2046 [Desulfocucumis palustris]
MSRFICDTCGREVLPVDGIVSWTREDKRLGNFKLTHKDTPGNKCQPENNRYRELYTLTLAHGYLEFISYLLERWEDNLVLDDPQTLRKVMGQLNLHIHEKLIMLMED